MEASCRSIGMLPEPDQIFGCMLRADFVSAACSTSFARVVRDPAPVCLLKLFVDYALPPMPVYMQSIILKRLYRESTQLVERVCPLRKRRESVGDKTLLYCGVAMSTRTFYLPTISKELLLSLVWSATLAHKPHPVIEHSNR